VSLILTSRAGCLQGLGNRLPSLVTGFALALLTDRVLFVDDSQGKYFGIFWPTFDCNYTQSRREARQITTPGWLLLPVRVAWVQGQGLSHMSAVWQPALCPSHPFLNAADGLPSDAESTRGLMTSTLWSSSAVPGHLAFSLAHPKRALRKKII
jgi:hypothetical protein